MHISSLLNPRREDYQEGRSPEFLTPSSTPRSMTPCTPVAGRQRIRKDAPIFTEGNTPVGIVNYPPHKVGNDKNLAKRHHDFQVYPFDEIDKYGVRHIPYNSDKKDFMDKTGKDAFEVYQYTYRVPGSGKDGKEAKAWAVLWDYNVGLVRMTPFFRSLAQNKTQPAKALRVNPGLKEISYSITGGALAGQGYWVPYEAAKALAATFCYHIRWALTPVFGNDFPALCLRPEDEGYYGYKIEPAIVQECAYATKLFREQGKAYQVTQVKQSVETYSPRVQFTSLSWAAKDPPREMAAREESGYYTSTDLATPQVSPRSTVCSPVNGSSSPLSLPVVGSSTYTFVARQLPPPSQLPPKSVPNHYYGRELRCKRTHSKVTVEDYGDNGRTAWLQPQVPSNDIGPDNELIKYENRFYTREEVEAAYALLQLRYGDAKRNSPKRTRNGSRY